MQGQQLEEMQLELEKLDRELEDLEEQKQLICVKAVELTTQSEEWADTGCRLEAELAAASAVAIRAVDPLPVAPSISTGGRGRGRGTGRRGKPTGVSRGRGAVSAQPSPAAESTDGVRKRAGPDEEQKEAKAARKTHGSEIRSDEGSSAVHGTAAIDSEHEGLGGSSVRKHSAEEANIAVEDERMRCLQFVNAAFKSKFVDEWLRGNSAPSATKQQCLIITRPGKAGGKVDDHG